MKKITVIALLLIITLAHVMGVGAEENITNFRSTIYINTDGTINVEEKIIYDFGDEPHHGIFRDIPTTIKNSDGRELVISMTDFSVTDGQGSSQPVQQSKEGSMIRLKIGNPDKYVSGIQTYVIKYKASGALRYFSDHDELYWNINGTGWNVPTADVQATVLLPQRVEGPQLKLACYTGRLGSTDADCAFTTDDRTIYFASKRPFGVSEGMTVVVGFPKGLVAVLEPKPVFWQTPLGVALLFAGAVLAGIVVLIWYIFYPVRIIYKWFKYGRDPKGTVGVVRAGFDPPKGPDGQLLTPSETGALLDEEVHQKDVAALMVDLARRGYLRIEERKKNDFYLVETTSKEKKRLLAFEKDLLEGLFATGAEVRLKDMQYTMSTTLRDIKKHLYDRLVTLGYFPKNPDSTRNFYIGIGIFGLFFTGNLPLFLAAMFFGRHLPQKTQSGSDAKNIAQSLKNFLGSQERQLAFQGKNQLLFEKLLPYAVAFGVEKTWAERFKDIDLKQPSWYTGYSGSRGFNSVVLSNSLHSSFGSLSKATATVSSSGSSSGFSGGSSGGGGGGGGGGSW